MKTFVDYLKKNKPNATIAVLKANDDFGQSYADTLTQLVKGTQLKIVKTEQYDSTGADVDTQVNNLAAHQGRRVPARGARCWRARPRSRRRRTPGGTRSRTCRARACRSCCFSVAGTGGQRRAQRHAAARPGRPEERDNPAMKLYKEQVAKYKPKADAARRHRRPTAGRPAALLVKTLESGEGSSTAAR